MKRIIILIAIALLFTGCEPSTPSTTDIGTQNPANVSADSGTLNPETSESISASGGLNPVNSQVSVGGLFGLSGFSATSGENSRNGFLLAIEDSGLDVEFIIEDHQSDVAKAVSSAQKLIYVDGVEVIIGPDWNQFSEAVAPLGKLEEVVFVSPWVTTEDEWITSNYFFSGTPSERSQIEKLIEYLESKNISTVSLIYANDIWSSNYANSFLELNRNFRVMSRQVVSSEETDFRLVLQKAALDKSDALFVVVPTDSQQIAINNELVKLGIKKPVVGPFSHLESAVVVNEFDEEFHHFIYPKPKEYDRAKEFSNKYEARFGKKPTSISAATSYDMTSLVLEAIKAGAETGEEISSYLLSVDGYDGFSNRISFNEFGMQAYEKVEVWEYRYGEAKVVYQ